MEIRKGPIAGNGLYTIPEEVYRPYPALNHSNLKNLFPPKTPLDFKFHLERPGKRSESMDFGSAVHLAVFESSRIEELICVAPDCDRRTAKGKEQYAEFKELAKGKFILSQDELDSVFWIVDAVNRNPLIQSILSDSPLFETAGIFSWGDVECKLKVDALIPNQRLIIDLKTTQAAHERAFAHSVHEYNYHTQAEFYMTGLEFLTGDVWEDFLWIAVESKAPHHIYLYEPEKLWLVTARDMIANAIELYKDCESTGIWPGVDPIKRVLSAPNWY